MDEQVERAGVRRMSWWSVGCAVLFMVFAVATTQVRALQAHSPWQDDPYHVVVSFTQLLVPALAVALALRIAGRRPRAAAVDLLHGGQAVVGMVLATAATDWIAVVLRVHQGTWGVAGRLLIAALALVTACAAAVAATTWRTARQARQAGQAGQAGQAWQAQQARQAQDDDPGDDGAEGVLTAIGDLAGRCGPAGRPAARAADWVRRVVIGGRHGVRRHRLAAGVLVSIAVSAGLTLTEAIGDGLGPHPAAAAAVRILIGTAGFVAALIPLNAYLGMLRPANATGRAARSMPAWRPAAYVAVASVPVTVGFRVAIGDFVDFRVVDWGRLAGLIAVVAVLSGLITLLLHATRRRRHWLTKTLLALPLALLLAIVGTVCYLGVRHLLPLALPAPTGPYRVGRTTFDWTDLSRADPLAPEPNRRRELSIWVWYPAPAATRGQPAPYAPGHWARMVQFGILTTRLDAVRTHSIAAAPVAAGRFPLVVLEPGLGLSAPQFATLAEDLASHGYVVAGVTPTYSANITVLNGRPVGPTPAGNPSDIDRANQDRLVTVWAADARFVADRMATLGGPPAGRLDASRVVYMGHSFGGAASLQACHDDPRCAGAVDMDGTPYGAVVHQGLSAPMMLLGTPGDCLAGTCHPTDAVDRDIDTASRTLRADSTGPSFRYEIAGAEHLNFTDYGAYYIPAPLRGLVQLGPINGDRCLTVVSAYLTAFADHVLRDGPAPQLDQRYPEARPVT
jgi:predicted dienelactone hydrolase